MQLVATGPYLGRTTFSGDTVLAVAMTRPNGDSLVAYFTVADTAPAGLRMYGMTPPVEVEWSHWSEIGGFHLFERAVFRQGTEEFIYQYDSIRVGAVPDSVFDGPTYRSPDDPDA